MSFRYFNPLVMAQRASHLLQIATSASQSKSLDVVAGEYSRTLSHVCQAHPFPDAIFQVLQRPLSASSTPQRETIFPRLVAPCTAVAINIQWINRLPLESTNNQGIFGSKTSLSVLAHHNAFQTTPRTSSTFIRRPQVGARPRHLL